MQVSQILSQCTDLICAAGTPIEPQTQLLGKCTGVRGVTLSVAVPWDENVIFCSDV